MRRPCLWEGALMSGEVWMGYLVDHNDAFTVVQSPFVLNGERVFGADSDATTLAIAGVLHRLQHDELPSLSLPDGIDGESLTAATNVPLHEAGEEEAHWELLLSDEATVVLARQNAEVELSPFDVEIEVDEEFHQAIASAWEQELSLTHVSQGAYVSRAQYEEAAASRLLLVGQAGQDSVMCGRLDFPTSSRAHNQHTSTFNERAPFKRGPRSRQRGRPLNFLFVHLCLEASAPYFSI